MPRPTQQRIIGTEVPEQSQRAVLTDVVARPVNTMVDPGSNELLQLADALGRVHAPLARMREKDDERGRQDAIIAARAAAAKAEDPTSATPEEVVAVTPPAFRREAEVAFQEGIGTRLGADAKGAFLDEYAKASQDPEFNFEGFAKDFRSKHLAGLTGPLAINAAPHIDSAIAQARADYRNLQEKRLTEARQSTLASALSSMDPNATVGERLFAFDKIAADNVDQGGTRAEAALAMFDQMSALSTQLNGRRDLFEVFDQEVPGLGKKLVDLVPGLKSRVESAKEQADATLKRYLHETTMVERGEQKSRIDKMLMDGSAIRMGADGFAQYLKQFTGPSGALNAEGYASAMHEYHKQAALEADKRTLADLAANGMLSLAPIEKAKPILAQALAPAMQGLVAAMKPGADPALLGDAANMIVSAHAQAGVDFADDQLKRFIGSVAQEVPKDGGDISPKFQGIARLYAAMERTSKPLLYAYFDDKTRTIFSTYNRATVEGQISSATAYKQAYAASDPEAIKAAEQRFANPTARAEITEKVRSTMRGLFAPGSGAWSPRFWGVTTLFKDAPITGPMENWAQNLALNHAKLNPDAGDDDIMRYVAEQTEANWYFAKDSNQYVQLPPAYNNAAGQEAIDGYLAAIKANNPNVRPTLLSKGNGVYDLVFYRGAVPEKVADNVSVESMLALRRATKMFTPEELRSLSSLRSRIEDGSATPEDLKGHEGVLSKARALGVWSPQLQMKADGLAVKAVMSRNATTFEPAVGTAMSRAEFDVVEAVKPKTPNTGDVASRFLAAGDLTGALAALGEGVRTVVYKDPAGVPTIGIGYNLQANAETLESDFRKAGIPVEQIDEIKAGTRHITVEQAMRLHSAIVPRYEAIAKGAVEERYPGEWAKLGANVRAVLTDIAYQTGNVKQFRDGLSAVLAGDLTGAGLEVRYKDDKTGQYRVAKGRHTLRTSMLRSSTHFKSLLTHAAKQPANALQLRLASGTGDS